MSLWKVDSMFYIALLSINFLHNLYTLYELANNKTTDGLQYL